jgi:hypothetical protein
MVKHPLQAKPHRGGIFRPDGAWLEGVKTRHIYRYSVPNGTIIKQKSGQN